jgi:hypothetical protein
LHQSGRQVGDGPVRLVVAVQDATGHRSVDSGVEIELLERHFMVGF